MAANVNNRGDGRQNLLDFDIESSDSEFEGFDLEDLIVNGNVHGFFAMENPENDREIEFDAKINWSKTDAPPTISPCSKT